MRGSSSLMQYLRTCQMFLGLVGINIYIYIYSSQYMLSIYTFIRILCIYIYQLYHFLWCAVWVSMCVSDARVTKLLSTGGWRLNSDSAGGGDISGGNHNPLEDFLVKTEVKSFGILWAFDVI